MHHMEPLEYILEGEKRREIFRETDQLSQAWRASNSEELVTIIVLTALRIREFLTLTTVQNAD